jgi:molybdopterin-guanine dinucleotide biosynthesis protein A
VTNTMGATPHRVAILAGGQSSRMGFDKAQARLGSQNLLERSVATASATSPVSIYVCGGPAELSAELGVEHLADTSLGQGPLVGLIAALSAAPGGVLVCMAVDLPSLQAGTILDVIGALTTADVVVPVLDGRRQWHLTAWNVELSHDPVATAFETGVRSFQKATESLEVAELETSAAAELVDVDTPAELRGVGGHPPPPHALS